MTTKTFDTKVGPLRYNVREMWTVGEKRYRSSLGYASSLKAARDLAERAIRNDPERRGAIAVVDAEKRVRARY